MIQVGTEWPFHKFYFLSRQEYPYPHNEWHRAIKATTPDVSISYEVLSYISYTLFWIPTYSVLGQKRGYGVYATEATILDSVSAPSAISILGSWANLIKSGPEAIEIAILYDSDIGEHIKLLFGRDSFVQGIASLVSYLSRSLDNSDLYILHIGI